MPRFARYLILAIISALVALFVASSSTPVGLRAAPSDPVGAPPSLKGQLLIATETIRDPRFDHAVILMVWHDRDGAFGIVINHPLGEKPLLDILALFGKKDATVTGSVPVFLGGPVQPQVSFVIHDADYHRPETQAIDTRLAMTPARQVLDDITRNRGPAKCLIAFGYAGWAPGQLENELSHNVWYTAPADPDIVFGGDRDKVWERAAARRTQDL
jgi:putative transcriptional regulator